MRSALVLAFVLAAACAACGKEGNDAGKGNDTGSGSAGAGAGLARGGADPKGPCTWVAEGRCMEYEALFGEAVAKATKVKVDAAFSSGRLVKTPSYFLQVDAARAPFKIVIEQLGELPPGGVKLTLRRWESRADGWLVGEDSYSTATPGASMQFVVKPETDAPNLVAVLAEPPIDFSVAVAPAK
jgi:hypothetical protein